MSMNVSIVSGRLTDNPKYTVNTEDPSKNRSWFRVACEDHYSKPDENGKKHVDYPACVCWGKTADNVAKYCQKGKAVFVKGRNRTSSKQRPDGSYDNYQEIVIDEIEFGADSQKNKAEQTAKTASEALPAGGPTLEQLAAMVAQLTAQQGAQPSAPKADPFPTKA